MVTKADNLCDCYIHAELPPLNKLNGGDCLEVGVWTHPNFPGQLFCQHHKEVCEPHYAPGWQRAHIAGQQPQPFSAEMVAYCQAEYRVKRMAVKVINGCFDIEDNSLQQNPYELAGQLVGLVAIDEGCTDTVACLLFLVQKEIYANWPKQAPAIPEPTVPTL